MNHSQYLLQLQIGAWTLYAMFTICLYGWLREMGRTDALAKENALLRGDVGVSDVVDLSHAQMVVVSGQRYIAVAVDAFTIELSDAVYPIPDERSGTRYGWSS